jgi:hypothetical protein
MSVVKKIRHDKPFKDLQKSPEALQRLDELERQICAPRKVVASFF